MSVPLVFFKQKTAYEMRISDWSSDVCSSDLRQSRDLPRRQPRQQGRRFRSRLWRCRGVRHHRHRAEGGGMILLTPEIHAALRANDIARIAAQADGQREPDPLPVVKFFNPMGAAPWLESELDEDGDTLFGLAELRFGCPELGAVSLSEIESVRMPEIGREQVG